MTIQTVVGDVASRIDEPFRPWILPLQDFVPGREPLQFLGGIAPERFRIRDGFLVLGLVLFDIGCSDRLGGRLIGPTFL